MEQLTIDNFSHKVIQASFDYPVLVQFWAPWCGPCHGLTNTLEQIEGKKEYPIRFYGLDVDQYTDLALQYKVMGLPHTKIFISGYELDHFSDPLPGQEIEWFIKNALVLPAILKYSHFTATVNAGYIQDLESDASKSRRKDVYDLTLARYYFFHDLAKSRAYLEEIPDESDQFEDRLFIRDLYPLMTVEFAHDGVQKKLWAAKNSLIKKNFESTYQFLLQANRINADNPSDFPRIVLQAFRQFLGGDHELNRKYQSQVSE